MNTPITFRSFRARLVLVAAAAVAALALAGLVTAEQAPAAGSGGVGLTSGDDARASGSGSGKYARLFAERTTRKDRRWARSTAECESGKNPNAIGGGGLYRGAFQFMRSTWKSSPKSPGGDPIDYSYRTQAVVAILLKKRDGAGHWPVCG